MPKYYHCFQVYDYKGGELSCSPNLSLEDFINSLVDEMCDAVESEEWADLLPEEDYLAYKAADYAIPWDKLTIDMITSIVHDHRGIYAGSGERVEEWFYTDDQGKLQPAVLTDEQEKIAFSRLKKHYASR